jgi:Transposase DDE domain
MTSVSDLAQTLQTLLTTTADRLATSTGCIRRHRKLTGATLVQTLVLGWLHQPEATLHHLAQMSATLGVGISPQGLDRRFTEQTATCLKQVLDAAVTHMIASDPVAIPLLQRFAGILIQDSSIVLLPAALADTWRGCGCADPQTAAAAVKLQVRLDLLTGALQGPLLQDGRVHDLKAPAQTFDLPAGALRLADLGYFSLDSLQRLSHNGVFWLSRWQAGTVLVDEHGQPVDLIPWLATPGDASVDCPVLLGQTYHLPARLLVVRVPPEVAQQRRNRLHAEAQRRGQMVSKVRLAAADWTIYLTNVPVERLTLQEALVLGHARWQIELRFKLWKSQGGVDESRSAHPWRILCELYAKLLAMVIQHWVLLTSCWCSADRSLVKAAQTVRSYVPALALALAGLVQLQAVLETLGRCVASGCRLNPRQQHPATAQLLLAASAGCPAATAPDRVGSAQRGTKFSKKA